MNWKHVEPLAGWSSNAEASAGGENTSHWIKAAAR
jgi:hypothetical protein